MITLLVLFSQSIIAVTTSLAITRKIDRCHKLVKTGASGLKKFVGIDSARKQLKVIVGAFKAQFNLNLNLSAGLIFRMISSYKNCNTSLDLMVKYLDEELVSQLKLPTGMERTIASMILNTVLPRKAEPVMTSIPVISRLSLNLSPERQSLSQLLEKLYETERQTFGIYHKKLALRQNIYSLFSKEMKEEIDLFLIGSSLTNMGSKSSDTDLCLVIYDSENKVDPKYEARDVILSKLEELSKILESNGMSTKAEVIPALVPILKFIETSSGIEININVNRLVTIRNTHLLYMYSRMDPRVAQLILTVKLWAKKNGINSAYNKSLTSYSISLMAIYFLQSVCSPPVVPCLQKTYQKLFVEDVTQLRLTTDSLIQFRSCNKQSLGQLFTQFFEYYSMFFNYDKVISVKSGTLLDKSQLISRPEANGRIWQWKCHICIEEPFIGTNTSHSVHDCRMFKEILQKFMDTYRQIITGSFTLSSNG